MSVVPRSTSFISAALTVLTAVCALTGCAALHTAAPAVGRTTPPSGVITPTLVPPAFPSPGAAAGSSSVTPATATAVTLVACPAGTRLPDGIDPRVCGPAPAAPAVLNPPGIFVLPSGNIWCELGYAESGADADMARCDVAGATFAPAPQPAAATTDPGTGQWDATTIELWSAAPTLGLDAPDPGGAGVALQDGTPITTLGYGQAASAGSIACVAQDIGVSCWNVHTTHGFFLSRNRYVLW